MSRHGDQGSQLRYLPARALADSHGAGGGCPSPLLAKSRCTNEPGYRDYDRRQLFGKEKICHKLSQGADLEGILLSTFADARRPSVSFNRCGQASPFVQGKHISTVRPPSERLRILMVPPWTPAARLAIARPMPKPDCCQYLDLSAR